MSSHDVYECFHTTIAECFQQKLPILHCHSQKQFTHLGLDSQTQIPEEWKETFALLNEMQPLPKHLSSQDDKPTNHSKTRADACDWWSAGHMTKDIAARKVDNLNNTHSSTVARAQSRQGQTQKGVSDSREEKAQLRRVMESEVRGHNHNPNESCIAVCSSTQTVGFRHFDQLEILIFVNICCAHSSICAQASSLFCLTCYIMYLSLGWKCLAFVLMLLVC